MQDFADDKNTTALPSNVTEFAWSTKIQDLLPGEWKTSDLWSTEQADLRDLLAHVTGLPRCVYNYCFFTILIFRRSATSIPTLLMSLLGISLCV
jgi:CubicO group peptidase (beta-lactamase class C family)